MPQRASAHVPSSVGKTLAVIEDLEAEARQPIGKAFEERIKHFYQVLVEHRKRHGYQQLYCTCISCNYEVNLRALMKKKTVDCLTTREDSRNFNFVLRWCR